MILENKNWRKRLLSFVLCFVMVMTMLPSAPIHAHATEASTEGVVEVTDPLSDVTEETTEPSTEATESTTDPAPVCDCGTDDGLIHATTCAVYVAPENPVCYCAEKCTEVNEWCDVCGFDYSKCTGTDTAVQYDGGAIDLSTLTETYLISDSGEYIFTGSGSYGIKVESGNPTIVLNNASITVGEGSAIDVASGSNATIFVLGDNTIGTTKTESWDAPCGGIFVAEGGTVNITSNGTDNILRAHGTLAAAIGGKYDYDNNESYNAGNISISNVTVYAYTNNFYASAIGAAGVGTCGTINITNAVVYAYGAGDNWSSAPGIGSAWGLVGWPETIPVVIISDSEVHTFRHNSGSDYIGYLGDVEMPTNATGSINCGEGGSVKSSIIYCYTGLDATTTDKVVKYGALGGLLKEDGTCEGEHSGGTATCTTLAVCENCGASYGERGNHSTAAEGDRAATCKELAYCSVCQENYGEVDSTNHASTEFTYTANEDGTTHKKAHKCCDATTAETEAHTLDVTTGKCSACGADMTAIATVTDSTNTYYAADAATLNQAVTAILETGSRTFTVELPADAEAEMITAIRRAICDTEGVDDGSINLTLKGVTTIPGTTNWDGVAFGPRNAQWDENNVEIVSHEEVTQLASVNLPDVTEIGAQAFLDCSNLTSITAPKVQFIGDWGLQGTAITSIDMPLLKEARYSAFCSTALTEVSLPSLETAGVIVFGHCKQLRTVDLPKLQNLSQQLFTRCTSLVSVSAPAATSMGINVFKGCSELVSITLPGVTELTNEAFAECTKLENITLGSVITKVNVNLFAGEALSSNITLTLHHDQANAEGDLKATEGTNVEWAGFTWKEVKFAHSYVDGKCTVCGEDCAHTGGTATCTTLAVCDTCGVSYGAVDTNNHDSSVECENGFCPNGCYEPATLNAEGFYEIFNAGQLYWFAQQVNIAGNTAANGKLMADIDLENRTWYPIGLYNDIAEAYGSPVQKQYAGTFDGNNHTVSNFTAIGNGSQGLFGYCNYSSAQIKNLGVINATVSGWNAGAVAGYCANLTNCYAVGCTITGASDTNTDAVTISSVGGNNGPTAIVNCWAYDCELIVGEGETNYVMHPVGGIRTSNSSGNIVQNCYYGEIVTEAEFTSTTGAVEKTEAQFASGEVAYLLGTAWGQTIGTDSYPVLGGKTVYEIKVCEKSAYSNTEGDVPHDYDENGFCTATPGETHYQPATDTNSDGVYEIANGGQLFWFANHINTVDRTASAVLTADIDLEGRPWTPIGSTGENNNNFRGVFDGQNHTIKGLYVEGTQNGVGFFGEVRTGTVKNFTIYGNVVVNTEVNYVGGVIGSICGLNSTDHGLERNGAVIQNITSFVNVTAKAHGIGMIGGFVGYANHQSLIEQCAWYGTFDAGEYRVDSGAGGFIGKIQENTSEVTIRNCGAYGTIKTNYAGDYNNTPTIYMGGFLSFSNTDAKTTLENCLFAGRFERGENLTDEARLGAFGTLRSVNAIKNCYYLGDDGLEAVHSDSDLKPGSDNVEITSVTGEQLKSGEVAWLLNGSQSEGVWKQNVGIDPYPSFTGNPVTKGDSEDMPYYNDGVVRVNISWTEMSFTYTVGQWDPETHTSSGGGWTADKENGGQITVTNSGGTNVPVSFTFQATMGDVSGIFTVEKAALAMGQSVTTTLSVTGDPKQSGFQDAQIGTVTVSLGSSGWAVGDKVTMYAKDGNDYVSTVAEVTGSKAVLVSDTSFSKNYTPSTQEDILALVDGPGARWPIYGEAAFANIIRPWLVDKLPVSSGYSGNTYSVFINNGTYRWLYKGSAGDVNQNVGNWKIGYKNTWIGRYIWDIPFAN